MTVKRSVGLIVIAVLYAVLCLSSCGQKPDLPKPAEEMGTRENGNPKQGVALHNSDLVHFLKAVEKTPQCKMTSCQTENYFKESKANAKPGECPDTPPVNPDIVLHEVDEIGASSHWIVFYSVTCPKCYVGDVIKIAIVKRQKNRFSILSEVKYVDKYLKIDLSDTVFAFNDIDKDGKKEILLDIKYATNHWCNSMLDKSNKVLVANISNFKIVTAFERHYHEANYEMASRYGTFRMRDETHDGRDDIVIIQSEEPDPCYLDAEGCGQPDDMEEYKHTKYLYVYEVDKDNWSSVYSGRAIGKISGELECSIPTPQTPFAIIAGSYEISSIDLHAQRNLEKLWDAGFKQACLYDTNDYDNLTPGYFAAIISAHPTRKDALALQRKVIEVGIKSYIKKVFK
ncbi:MAG: hypothetical protein GY854_20655 [Deltaproteobacteria bacterium]|nr:hypothetical protein [Deltaproteobacteria bacterium]